MLRNLLYSSFLHFVVLVLIYFNSKSLYYQNLSLFNKKDSRSEIQINVVSTKDLEEEKEEILEPIQQKKRDIIISDSEILSSLKEAKEEELVKKDIVKAEKESPEVLKNFDYVEKPDEEIEEEPEQEEESAPKIEEEETTLFDTIKDEETQPEESPKRELISTNDDEFEKAMEEVMGNEDIKNVIKLSLRERVNIQRQIKSCYKMAILKSGIDSKATVILNVFLYRDGNIDMGKIDVVDKEEYDKLEANEKRNFDTALANAKNALIFCSPLRNLPDNKYKVWREMSLEFDSSTLQLDK